MLDLLQPSVEPLLSLLPPGGSSDQTRDLLSAERLRSALDPLVEAGHLVVIQSPGIGTVEGEAIIGAADLGLVVVDLGRSRPRELAPLWSAGRDAGPTRRRRRRTSAAVCTPARAPAGFGGRRAARRPSTVTSSARTAPAEHSVGATR